jgi:glucose-6-phosphate isomerase
MSVTASRLGSAPLRIDWSALHKGGAPGTSAVRSAEEAWDLLKGRFQAGEIGFYDAPLQDAISQLEASKRLAVELKAEGRFQDILFLGIGGSALGPLCVLSALREKAEKGPRFHFVENPDPTEWKLTLSQLNPASTLVICVTKSGTTFETLAQFLCALEWLTPRLWATHTVVLTDPAKGDLLQFARQKNLRTLAIHPSLGGRFSVFSPVGFLAMALAGLDVDAFVLGAQQVRNFVEKTPVAKNPLFILAQEFLKQARQRSTHVLMPYATPLRLTGDWFVQLWGESLGKDGKGFTPIGALGATDQHSILQLLRDGPDDKITLFVTLDHWADPVQIPRTLAGTELARFPAFQLLQGHTLGELLHVEQQAIAKVLTKRSRPNLTIQLDTLDERAIGALLFSFCVLTAVTGTLWGVDPFDQPGVEEGKVYIRESLDSQTTERIRALDAEENSAVSRLRRSTED